MKLKVEVVSSERVKPSSPTPPHLRRYDMSFLDQLAPPIYMPIVLFFPKEPNSTLSNQNRLDQLKKSLAETLALYHPFAGALRESDLSVDCNDEGALFVEAKTDVELSRVLDNPNPNELNDLLAVELDDEKVGELPVAAMATFFACGGMAVSLCVNHRIADALTFFVFLNAWSAVSRGEGDGVSPPCFGAGKLFPAKELGGYSSKNGIVKDDMVARRFVFDAQKINELRVRYEDKTSVEFTRRPTRVEALSAFIWNRMVAATKPIDSDATTNNNRICTMLHAVNLRPRVDPPLPENYFGNISRIAVSIPPPEESNNQNNNKATAIIGHVRDSIKKIDADFVKNLREGGDGHLSFLRQRLAQVNAGEIVSFSFTSLCRFPIYDADFGWGKPAFVASVRLLYKNLVSFFDTKSGEGIEAWINMRSEDMARFEADEEVLAYASTRLNPSFNM